MFGIGAGELVLILIAGLIIFGPGELPKVGRAIGKGLREFKKAQSALSATLDEVSAESEKKSPPTEKVSVEKKSVEVAEEKNISIEKEFVAGKKAETENKPAENISTEKNIPAIENISAEEKPPHSALTADDVINLAKQNPIPKASVTLDPVNATNSQTEESLSPRSNVSKEEEKLNEKNFTDTATTSTVTADTNASNVTAGCNTNSTAK